MNWYLEALKKYAVFSGRAGRREYWYFTLINTIALFVLWLMSMGVGDFDPDVIISLLGGFMLALVVPSVAVSVRRLHDTNRIGWLFLVGFVPGIGQIIWLYFMLCASNPGPNKYGPTEAEMKEL